MPCGSDGNSASIGDSGDSDDGDRDAGDSSNLNQGVTKGYTV